MSMRRFGVSWNQALTLGPRRLDRVVIRTTGDEKAGFSVVGIISAAGCTFPLIMIAAGKTTTVEKNWFGDGHNILLEKITPDPLPNPSFMSTISRENSIPVFTPISLTDRSCNGWTNIETWLNNLIAVRFNWFPVDTIEEFYLPASTIILLADSYPAHFANAAKRLSILLNIHLAKVPESLTDLYQPLDTSIFGSVKSRARNYLNT